MRDLDQNIRNAETALAEATKQYTAFIFRCIADAGNREKLAKKTGIKQGRIQRALAEGTILSLKKLADDLQAFRKRPGLCAIYTNAAAVKNAGDDQKKTDTEN